MTAKTEREMIVAWLRGEAASDNGSEEHILTWAANKIQRGDHLPSKQEKNDGG